MKLPSPADVRAEFDRRFAVDSESATNYLYQLGVDCGYIKQEAIARNICWESPSPWGPLEITINCSKPEKDPRAIAAAAQEGALIEGPTGEPQCDLCWENETWPGSPGHPVKPGLRIAAIMLGGERWGLQFSPYSYFPEHCIALAAQHRPMVIDGTAIGRLLDFVDLFPFYFIGSNADLPIVGGSILSHDHFQGGRHQFPLMKAPLQQRVKLHQFPAVEAGIVDWPAGTLRLESHDRSALQQAAGHILEAWRNFSFPEANILAYGEEGNATAVMNTMSHDPRWPMRAAEPEATSAQPEHDTNAPLTSNESQAEALHNTLNPIVTKDAGAGVYTLHLVLRNNRTDAAHPWGIFHPTANLHHIKKENIGLIEIMGRAILPGRLAKELPAVQKALLDAAAKKTTPDKLQVQLEANPLTTAHAPWATAIYRRRFWKPEPPSKAAATHAVTGIDVPHPIMAASASSAPTTDTPPATVSQTSAAGTLATDSPATSLRMAEILSLPKAPTASGSSPAGASDFSPAGAPTLLPWMQEEVGDVFAQVLACTGVFKNDDVGRAGWAAFLSAIDAEPVPRKKAQ